MANNYKIKMKDIQNKYKFKIFCAGYEYDDTELRNEISQRALISEAGRYVELELNPNTYVLTAKLKDKNNNVISTSTPIDLPLESMIVDCDYDATTKSLIITLQNGNTTSIPLGDLIDGLATEEDLNAVKEELDKYKTIYNVLPKIEDEGEALTLDDTGNATLKMDLKGNTSQSGEPTPDAPIPVNVVSGDNSIEVKGYNLYNVNDTNAVANGYIVQSDGTLKLSEIDNTSGSSPMFKNFTLPITQFKENTTYSFVLEILSVSGTGHITINESNATTQFNAISSLASKTFDSLHTGDIIVGTATTKADFNNCIKALSSYCYFLAGEKGSITFRLSIINSTSVTPQTFIYQPYKSASYPISLGNMCKDFTLGYVDIDGTIHSSTMWITTKDYITIEPNTSYTFKANSPSTRCLIGEYDANKTFISPRQEIVLENTYTTTNDTKYIKFSIYDGSTNIEMYKTGTTPIELCKIGDYQDKIFKNTPNTTDYDSNLEDNVWYVKKEIGKVVLDGSENWAEYSSQTSDGYRVYETTKPAGPNNAFWANNGAYSNYFKATNGFATKNSMTGTKYGIYVNIDNTIVNTIANFKTWLSTHNTEAHYPLETPTYIEIEDTTLISQLDVLKTAMSYKGQTNISQINNDAPFIIDATALKDLSNL